MNADPTELQIEQETVIISLSILSVLFEEKSHYDTLFLVWFGFMVYQPCKLFYATVLFIYILSIYDL